MTEDAGVASTCQDIPVQEIVTICGVSKGTAEHYKAGRRKPPSPTLKLLRLYRDNRVLSDERWDGFRVVGDRMFAPGSSRPFSPRHVYAWELLWHALAETSPDRYRALLDQLSE